MFQLNFLKNTIMQLNENPKILYSISIKEEIKNVLIEKIKSFSFKPKLSIIQIGDREDSNIYVNNKKKFGEDIGASVDILKLDYHISENDLKNEIDRLNNDSSVNGIIIQLPIPPHLDRKVLDFIDYKKDVDGLTSFNTAKVFLGEKSIIPATTRAIFTLLDHFNIEVSGKNVVIVGRSNLVGKPTIMAMLKRNATVHIIHRQTKNKEEISKMADILIVSAGSPHLVDEKWINRLKETVVIDVGISKVEGKILGDVDFEKVKGLVSAISPVPGGVGPLTVASLFQNLVDLVS